MKLRKIKQLMVKGRRFRFKSWRDDIECWYEDGKFICENEGRIEDAEGLFDYPKSFELIEEEKMNTREAMQALLDGKTLIDRGGEEIVFSVDDSIFYVTDGSQRPWISLKGCTIKKDWRNEVSEENPILCHVDFIEGRFNHLAIITSFDPEKSIPYGEGNNMVWKYAKPIKPEECYGYKD